MTLSVEGAETPGPDLADPVIDLRAEVAAGQTVRFSCSLGGGASFRAFGGAIPLAKFSWWKGSRPALFSFTRGTQGGSVDVDWVHVSRPGDAGAGGQQPSMTGLVSVPMAPMLTSTTSPGPR